MIRGGDDDAMARLLFACLLFFVAIIQATILPGLHVAGVMPDLVLVLLLVWSALRGTGEALIWVFAAGLLLDVLAMDPLGTNGLALMIVALLAGPARRRFFNSGLVFPVGLAAVATVIHAFVLLVLRSRSGEAFALTASFRPIVIQALLDAVLVPPLYLIATRMDRWVVRSHG